MLRTTAILTAGLLIGGGAVQVLHAQMKPPGYLLAEVAVTVDEATYKDSEFMKQTVPTIKSAGGKYLAGGFNNATALSGAAPANRLVLLQFDSIDKAKAFTLTVRPSARRSLVAKSPRASASWQLKASISKDEPYKLYAPGFGSALFSSGTSLHTFASLPATASTDRSTLWSQ